MAVATRRRKIAGAMEPRRTDPHPCLYAAAGGRAHELCDAKVQKVGAALREITRVHENYEARLTAAETVVERQGLQNEAQAVMIEAVEAQGLSVGEFNEVVEAADEDPTVRDRVLAATNSG